MRSSGVWTKLLNSGSISFPHLNLAAFVDLFKLLLINSENLRTHDNLGRGSGERHYFRPLDRHGDDVWRHIHIQVAAHSDCLVPGCGPARCSPHLLPTFHRARGDQHGLGLLRLQFGGIKSGARTQVWGVCRGVSLWFMLVAGHRLMGSLERGNGRGSGGVS